MQVEPLTSGNFAQHGDVLASPTANGRPDAAEFAAVTPFDVDPA